MRDRIQTIEAPAQCRNIIGRGDIRLGQQQNIGNAGLLHGLRLAVELADAVSRINRRDHPLDVKDLRQPVVRAHGQKHRRRIRQPAGVRASSSS